MPSLRTSGHLHRVPRGGIGLRLRGHDLPGGGSRGGVQVYVPSAFTPDNDGVNDAFLPSIHPLDQVEDYQLQIFNRWGELVFVTLDPEQLWLGGYPGGTHYVGNEVFTYVLILDTDLDPLPEDRHVR